MTPALLARAWSAIQLAFSLFALTWIARFEDLGVPALPLWPVRWIALVPHASLWVQALHVGAVVAAVAALMRPRSQAFRFCAWALFFEVVALRFSYGKISHGWHAWLWAGLVLSTMRIEDDAQARERVSLARAFILLFYSLSGFWKVTGAALDIASGAPSVFSPDAPAIQIASQSFLEGSGPFGRFMADHSAAFAPLVVVVAVTELLGLAVLFRPRWQRAYGCAAIAFHLGVWLTMRIQFFPHALAVLLLLVLSPPETDGESPGR